eukprot:gnl/Hemi2/12549_TR4285_c0_g1_i1.p1 gnl/Hemi2/12549_TR4285_c0_g1~~gnl/Hemi2/12549_TR4285_c0_g1_i1.p1  ORF type:complete len:481 (+),score=147.47 gnl/Hemi2/12549_TR4285_c0_g1_i1:71-1513(+)
MGCCQSAETQPWMLAPDLWASESSDDAFTTDVQPTSAKRRCCEKRPPRQQRLMHPYSHPAAAAAPADGASDLTVCLPDDVVRHIFSMLGVRDRLTAGSVARRFARLAADPHLWRELDLSPFSARVSDAMLLRALPLFSSLTSLTLRDCRLVTDDAICQVARASSTHLTSMDLCDALSVGDAGLQGLAAHCPNLKTLNLGGGLWAGARSISDASIQALAEKCPHLSNLNFFGCKSITDASLAALGRCCKELTALNFGGCKDLTDEGLKSLSNCRALQQVHFGGCVLITDDGLGALAEGCTALRQASFDGCKLLTDEAMLKLSKHCPLLSQVNFDDCVSITDAGLRHLSLCRDLRAVHFGGFARRRITDVGLEHLASNCKLLQQVDVGMFGGCQKITDRSLQSLAGNCLSLKQLNVGGCQSITDLGVQQLALRCQQLQWVDFSGCKNITEAGLNFLYSKCPLLLEVKSPGGQRFPRPRPTSA